MRAGIFFSLGIFLLALGDLAPSSLEPLGTLSQVSAVAILGYIAIYVVTRLLPRQHKEYVRALERLQDQQAAEAKEFRALVLRLLEEGHGTDEAESDP